MPYKKTMTEDPKEESRLRLLWRTLSLRSLKRTLPIRTLKRTPSLRTVNRILSLRTLIRTLLLRTLKRTLKRTLSNIDTTSGDYKKYSNYGLGKVSFLRLHYCKLKAHTLFVFNIRAVKNAVSLYSVF